MRFLVKSMFIGLTVLALGMGILLAFVIPPWQLIVAESFLLLLLGIWLLLDKGC